METETVAKALVDSFVIKLGVSHQIYTDTFNINKTNNKWICGENRPNTGAFNGSIL